MTLPGTLVGTPLPVPSPLSLPVPVPLSVLDHATEWSNCLNGTGYLNLGLQEVLRTPDT